jgi:Na+-translocating ferredoxin:NAD+ oxidoreductase RnfG subunit
MHRRSLLAILLSTILAPAIARAEHYLDAAGAAKALFPEADSFADATAALDGPQADAVKARSGMRVRQKKITGLKALKGGAVIGWTYVDDVIGKHEFITYAAGIDALGAVRGVEIMDYRETWGGAVREASWRKQFKGRTLADPVKLEKDIKNVSGATLSCRNVTDGVRRLLATHAVLKR